MTTMEVIQDNGGQKLLHCTKDIRIPKRTSLNLLCDRNALGNTEGVERTLGRERAKHLPPNL